MVKFIIILMQDSADKDFHFSVYIGDVSDLFLLNNHGHLMMFNSKYDADNYREEHAVDGQIIEIPFY